MCPHISPKAVIFPLKGPFLASTRSKRLLGLSLALSASVPAESELLRGGDLWLWALRHDGTSRYPAPKGVSAYPQPQSRVFYSLLLAPI